MPIKHKVPSELDKEGEVRWLYKLETFFPCEIEIRGSYYFFNDNSEFENFIFDWEDKK